MRRRRAEGGYAVVWILVVLAVIAAGIGSIEFTVDERPPNPTMYWVFGIGLTIAALGMFVEAKRDLYQCCGFALVFAVVTGMITGAVALFGTTSHPVAATVAAISAMVTVACIVYLFKTQYGREVLPNILRQEFHRSVIFETDGVQFAVRQSNTEIVAGEGLAVQVVAQNCWDKERQLTFVLKPETRISFNRAGLKFPAESKVIIPGASVAVLTIPVVAEPKAKGKYSLSASPKVAGDGGTRVRRWRAQGLSSQIPPWLTALGALGGLLVWGGGMKIRVRVTPTKTAEAAEAVPLEPQTEVVWQPEPHDLAAAVRAA